MVIRINLLIFGFLLFINNQLQTNSLYSVSLLGDSLVKLTLTEQINEKIFLIVRQIEDTSKIEITLLNNSKKPIIFVDSFNLNDIEVELRDNLGQLVKKRQEKQTKNRDGIILKPNEGSRQIVTIPRGEKKVIAKINIKNRFELTSGNYYVVVKKSIRLEGKKDYQVVKSAPLKIKL